jgi:hypothetical protein
MGAVSASRFLANVALLSVITAMGGTEEDRATAKAHLVAALATSREAEDRLVAML